MGDRNNAEEHAQDERLYFYAKEIGITEASRDEARTLPNRHIYLPELDNNLHHELDRAVAEGLSDGFKDALAVPNEESVRKEVLREVDS